jgi:hypothetical protein
VQCVKPDGSVVPQIVGDDPVMRPRDVPAQSLATVGDFTAQLPMEGW